MRSYERSLEGLPKDVVAAARQAEHDVLAGAEASYSPKMLVGPLRAVFAPARPIQLRLRRQYRLIAVVVGNEWRFSWVGSHEEANRVTQRGWPG